MFRPSSARLCAATPFPLVCTLPYVFVSLPFPYSPIPLSLSIYISVFLTRSLTTLNSPREARALAPYLTEPSPSSITPVLPSTLVPLQRYSHPFLTILAYRLSRPSTPTKSYTRAGLQGIVNCSCSANLHKSILNQPSSPATSAPPGVPQLYCERVQVPLSYKLPPPLSIRRFQYQLYIYMYTFCVGVRAYSTIDPFVRRCKCCTVITAAVMLHVGWNKSVLS